MIIDHGVESVTIQNGFLSALVKVKTDNGIVGITVSFELRKEPKLDALVPIIDAAVKQAMANTLNIYPTSQLEPAKA